MAHQIGSTGSAFKMPQKSQKLQRNAHLSCSKGKKGAKDMQKLRNFGKSTLPIGAGFGILFLKSNWVISRISRIMHPKNLRIFNNVKGGAAISRHASSRTYQTFKAPMLGGGFIFF